MNSLTLVVKLVDKIFLFWCDVLGSPATLAILVDVQKSNLPRDENPKFFYHNCPFVRGTFISWNFVGEIFRLEMAAVLVNGFLFHIKWEILSFLLSSTKLLWCFLNSLYPTFHQLLLLLHIFSLKKCSMREFSGSWDLAIFQVWSIFKNC